MEPSVDSNDERLWQRAETGMRRMKWAALSFAIVAASAGAGSAQTVIGAGLEPPEQQQRVVEAVTGHVGAGEAIFIRGLKPSLARNGRGYCGEVGMAEAGPFSPFQVILDADGSVSVLVETDADRPDATVPREVATMLLRNAGCLE